MPTPLVRIRLGAPWERHKAGKVVQVDAVRGRWLLDNIEGSEPASKLSAEHLGMVWPYTGEEVGDREAPEALDPVEAAEAKDDLDYNDGYGEDLKGD